MCRVNMDNICQHFTIIFNILRATNRSYRRLMLSFVLCLMLYISKSVYFHVIDFYIPSMQPEPHRMDMSKMAIIKGQEKFIPSVMEPATIKDNLFILVLINSAANSEAHRQKRMAIRNTWGKPIGEHGQWKTIFFLGKTYKASVDQARELEAKKYGDIIIGDFPDTYRNITQKLIMAFNWASKQNYEYLLKTDDDVYINIPSLIKWIKERPHPNVPLYAGVLYRVNIIRDPLHKHFVKWEDLPQKRYPWYPKGALYVLSSGIVRGMVQITNRVKMITVDDAYVGVLASFLGVKPVRLHGFIQWGFLPNLLELFDQCTYLNIFGMADNLTPDDIYFVHQEVTLLQNKSKWMCVHIYHPVLATIALLIFVIVIIYKRRQNIL